MIEQQTPTVTAEPRNGVSEGREQAPGLPGPDTASEALRAKRSNVPRRVQPVTCPRCDARWTGHRIEHCPAAGCHLTFSGTTAGDKHRVGEHGVTTGPDRRRCLTIDEMRAVTAADGSPWFSEKLNAHGTVIWGWNRPSTWWTDLAEGEPS